MKNKTLLLIFSISTSIFFGLFYFGQTTKPSIIATLLISSFFGLCVMWFINEQVKDEVIQKEWKEKYRKQREALYRDSNSSSDCGYYSSSGSDSYSSSSSSGGMMGTTTNFYNAADD